MRYRFDRGVATKIKTFQTRFINSTTALVVAITGLGSGLPVLLEHTVFAAPHATLAVCATTCTYPTIQDAVNAASPGDVIAIKDNQTVTSPIAINIPLTIERSGANGAIATSGSHDVFTINGGGAGTTIKNLPLTKTDHTSQNEFISIIANDVTISGNTFTSQWNIGDGETVRALGVSGVTGLSIVHNQFVHLRQPAYINAAAGDIKNNYTADTKGWVVVSQSNLNFVHNTWGTGADRNVEDIAIIADHPVGANNYPDSKIVQMSNQNNDAVVENQWPDNPGNPATAVLSDVFVSSSASTGGDGTPLTPYNTIQDAMHRVAEGGTVHIANGTYNGSINVLKDGTQIVGESEAGVQVNQTSATTYGMGVSVVGLSKVSISNMTFNTAAGSPVSYALQAYQSSKFTLNNVAFSGPGKTGLNSYSKGIGGVDLNSSQSVTYNNVSVSNFSKNGFSVTAKYATTDSYSHSITFNGVTAEGNAWDGIAFYTTNSSGTVGHNITGVQFKSTNTVSNNGLGSPTQGGIFVEGDSDNNYAANFLGGGSNGQPRYSVTTSHGVLDLGNTNFTGNQGYDITNYQKSGVSALSATFNGLTGNQMNATQRSAEDLVIWDKLDRSVLGLVQYYNLPTVPTNLQLFDSNNKQIPNGGGTNSYTVTAKWDAVSGADHYMYKYWNDIPTSSYDGEAHALAWSVPTNQYTGVFNQGEGTHYFEVAACDAANNCSAYSSPFEVIYDHHSPTAWFTATPPTYVNGNFDVQGAASDNVALKGALFDVRDPHDTTGNSWRAGCVNGTFTSNPATIAGSTSATFHCTINTANLTDGYTYILRVHAGDYANYGGGQQYNLIVDRTKPTVKMNLNRNGYLSNGGVTSAAQNPEIEAFDTNLTEIQIVDQNGNEVTHWGNGKSSVTPGKTTYKKVGWLGEGTYKVYAYDAAGNVSDVFTFTIDNTAPAVPTNLSWLDANGNPATNGFTNVQKGNLSWQDSDASTDHYVYKFWTNIPGYLNDANNPWTTDDSKYFNGASIWTDFDNYEGTYYFCVEAVDAVGNTSACSDTYAVTYDSTAPDVPAASPAGGNFQSSPTVTLSANDNPGGSGISSVYYTTDGSDPTTSTTRQLYTSSSTIVPSSSQPNGQTVIKAVAYDNAGNASSVMTETYNVAPTITEGSITPTTDTIIIVWTTDHAATSRVVYDTVSHSDAYVAAHNSADNYGYANSVDNGSAKTLNHSVMLTGLTPGTTYYFRLISEGSPEAVSTEFSSVTLDKKLTKQNNGTPTFVATTIQNGNNGQVLGVQTTTPNTPANDSQTNGQVQGDQTSNSNSNKDKTVTKSSNFLGLGWWWLLVLAVILAFLWFVLGKANTDDKKA